MRIFSISDLHIDYKENLQWLENISAEDYKEDLLILAGDISDNFRLVIQTLQTLKLKFKEVSFMPGNHDIWIKANDFENSIVKLDAILTATMEMNIKIQPFEFGSIQIVPIYSWYDFSFGEPSDDLLYQWNDFHRCKWSGIVDQNDIASILFDYNPSYNQYDRKTISFSHFVPRIDLFPKGPPKIIAKLLPCFGSVKIEHAIRKLKSDVHIYGHSHLNWDAEKNGTRYINNAYGYPSETRITRKHLFEIEVN